MTTGSPFTLDRFEYEQTHLYYLPENAFRILESTKSTYLIGSRGTGKTTLLNALRCEEQLSNPFLMEHMTGGLRDRGYIGVYLRMPAYQTTIFETWLQNETDEFRGSIFGLYLDLVWLEALINSFSGLLAKGEIASPVSREYQATDTILEKHPQILTGTEKAPRIALKRFSTILYNRRRELENLALVQSVVKPADLARRFPLGQIGELGRTVAKALEPVGWKGTGHDSKGWLFKICFDEAECLTPFQQKVMNTHVRLAQIPLSFVVSYVRTMDDMQSTLIHGMSLSKPDRAVLILDDINDQEFEQLAEGVASVRIQRQMGKAAEPFSTRRVLGSLDINSLLHNMLRSSESNAARDWLAKAGELSSAPFFRNESATLLDGSIPQEGACPPIYQAYLIDRLRLRVPSPDEPTWKRRAQDSAELRKRMVGAYLCLCKELGHDVKYASAEMVFQMSDKCVRDFLAQMDEIFVEAKRPLQDFLARKVSVDSQDSALKAASSNKKGFVNRSDVASPTETLVIVDALGQLTTKLQTATYKNQGLLSSERGIFALVGNVSREELEQTTRLLVEAAEAGFLRIIDKSKDTLKFRVHCSLAAAYGFSYRGAYYEVRLHASDLVVLQREKDPEDSSKHIERMANQLVESSDNLSLFEDTK